MPPTELDELVERTEGWPAGLYLAALAIQSGTPPTGSTFTGDDRLVDDYLRSELLDRLPRSQRDFLVERPILDRMSGPLCDAVTGGQGQPGPWRSWNGTTCLSSRWIGAATGIATTTCFGSCCRPSSAAVTLTSSDELHSRAADWYEANGMAEEAVDHADLAGDTERQARLVLQLMQPVWASGRVDTVRSWMERLNAKAQVPFGAAIDAHGALIFALIGRPREAERWAGVAESDPATACCPTATPSPPRSPTCGPSWVATARPRSGLTLRWRSTV